LKELVRINTDYINNLNAELVFEETFPGYQVKPNGIFVRKLKETYERMDLKWETQDFRSHSDGNILWAAGVNPIILGPGRLEAAHTPEESVSFNQVVQAAQLFINYTLSLL
jgi:acetylornithine deacetylase